MSDEELRLRDELAVMRKERDAAESRAMLAWTALDAISRHAEAIRVLAARALERMEQR